MNKLVIFLVCCCLIIPAGISLLVPTVYAEGPGDVNNDSLVDNSDVTYLLSYLFMGSSSPPHPIDADIDGSPGINLGDVLQLIGYLYTGCDLLPYTGVSVRVGSQIRFSSDLIFPIDTVTHSTQDTTYIKIIDNGGPDLMGMIIPISYASQPGEVEVTLNQVSFSGSILPTAWTKNAVIDNVNKTVLLYLYPQFPTLPSLDSGTVGTVATLYFTKTVNGRPLAISATEVPPSHQFILIGSYCADTLGGVSPSERIFTPMLSLALNGDSNCDGIVDVGDVVYTINYLYRHGPPPCGM
jgi:hypothetical protein